MNFWTQKWGFCEMKIDIKIDYDIAGWFSVVFQDPFVCTKKFSKIHQILHWLTLFNDRYGKFNKYKLYMLDAYYCDIL